MRRNARPAFGRLDGRTAQQARLGTDRGRDQLRLSRNGQNRKEQAGKKDASHGGDPMAPAEKVSLTSTFHHW
jgi:hypothetical protein